MNVNNELQYALQIHRGLLSCRDHDAFLLVSRSTDRKVFFRAAGEFSDLFCGLFTAACDDEQLRALVQATAIALSAWERQQEARKGKGGEV